MKISYAWLQDYVKHNLSPEALDELLTMSGLEVEEIATVGESLDGVIVGHVLEAAQHPNADRLRVCRVELGDEETVQIVCGAPNVASGQKVAVALVGSQLPNPEKPEKPIRIKKAKMRGEVSMGMICAEDELGLSDNHSGIMVLPDDALVGQPFATYLASHGRSMSDHVLDIAITPNRPDAISHVGVARDVAALQRTPLIRPDVLLPAAGGEAAQHITVDIHAPEGCGRYVAMVVRDIRVQESPNWLKRRLEVIGLRPRNNVVDITNYVMHECGQPLHAFDYDQIADKRIIVRFTEQEHPFTTLDAKRRTLPTGTLMIADAERDVAIAGIMGGENSEVTDGTTNVLIESAYFDPSTIRRTSKLLQLQTDASYRFERGVDSDGQVWAAARAAQLMHEYGGGEIVPGMVDEHPRPTPIKHVSLRIARIPRILGVEIDAHTAKRLLTAIGFEVSVQASGILSCSVPSFRPDVTREIDLIEEVGRLFGYDRVPETTHSLVPSHTPLELPSHTIRRMVFSLLTGLGIREIYTNSMLPKAKAEHFLLPALQGFADDAGVVETLNPISQEMAALRPTLLPGMLQVMSHNWNHGQRVLRFAEVGHVFHRTRGDTSYIPGYGERESALIAMSGEQTTGAWDTPPRPADLFDMKGLVEHLLSSLRIPRVRMTEGEAPTTLTAYHLNIVSGKRPLGYVARLSDHLAEEHDLKEPVFFAELDWQAVVEAATPHLMVRYRDVSRFPVVDRDLAFLVDATTPAGRMLDTIRKAGQPLLQNASVFDLYQGEGIEAQKKSIAFSLRFASKRTLKDAEVDARIKAIVGQLEIRHQAILRRK